MTLRLASLSFALALGAALAACGSGPADPRVIPGGGLADGEIDGTLHVYVVDKDTDAPISGAAVQLEQATGAALTGTTDATGLFSFKGSFKGKQTVTASASGYVRETWIGANGTNLTIPLGSSAAAATPPTGTVSGSVSGFGDARYAPSTNHLTVAVVSYTWSRDLFAAENNVAGGQAVCVRPAVSTCDFSISTRVGRVSVYALLYDVDTKGTPTVTTDDTRAVVGFGVHRNINVTEGGTVSAQDIPLVADSDMVPLSVTFQTAPAGLTNVSDIPLLNLGDDGIALLAIPQQAPLRPTTNLTKVPALSGDAAGGSYDFISIANGSVTATALLYKHAVTDISAAVDLGPWLTPPTNLTITGGTYSFGATAGADVYIVNIAPATGGATWNLLILDDTVSFTLPAITPDILAVGTSYRLGVNAVDLPASFDATDFVLDAQEHAWERTSAESATFTH